MNLDDSLLGLMEPLSKKQTVCFCFAYIKKCGLVDFEIKFLDWKLAEKIEEASLL